MRFRTHLSEQCARRYRAAGWWAAGTLLDDFAAAVARAPSAVAVVGPNGQSLTFAELADQSLRVAARFADLGLQQGDVVSVQLPNWIEFVTVHLAATRLGAVTNPLLPSCRGDALSSMLRLARTSILVIPGTYRNCDYPAMLAALWPGLPDLRHVVVVNGAAPASMLAYGELCASAPASLPQCPVHGDEVSALVWTAGGDSTPKAVMHSHDTLAYGTRALPARLGLTHDDVIWASSPLGHATGFQWGMRLALTLGCKLVLQDPWSPGDALRLVGAEHCTFTVAPPADVKTLVDSLASARGYSSSLRVIGCVGAPIPRSLGLEVHDNLDCTLVGMWGMAECFIGSTSLVDDPEEKIWGTDGRALPGGELAVFDRTRTRLLSPGEPGELATRGPHVALGYLDDPERTAQAFSPEGWLFTGDVASQDAEGYVRVVGRKKNGDGLKRGVRDFEEGLLSRQLLGAHIDSVDQKPGFAIRKLSSRPDRDKL